jgi:hypothetical protein
MKIDGVHEKFIYHPQEPHVMLPDLSPMIHGLKKGKMRTGPTRAHEKLSSIVKQKAAICYDTR